MASRGEKMARKRWGSAMNSAENSQNTEFTHPQTPSAGEGAFEHAQNSVNSLPNSAQNLQNSLNSAQNSQNQSEAKTPPRLAIIMPCYNEEAIIATTYAAITRKLAALIAQGKVSRESFVCFVDDGSKDKTIEILLSLKNGLNSPLGDSFAQSFHPASLRRNTPHSQGETIAQSNTANSIILEKNSQNATQNSQENSQANKSPALAEGDLGSNGRSAECKKQTLSKSPSSVIGVPRSDTQTLILKLAKNYGQQSALLAGLEFVKDRCECAVSLDCDLQQDINAIDEMLSHFAQGCEIVYGVRNARRSDTAFKKYTAQSFYKFMQLLGVRLLYNHADYRLMSARAIKNLLEFSEVNLFLRGIVPQLGLKSAVVHYERLARTAGVTKYSFAKLFALAWDGITSFSIAPLRALSALGVVLCALCVVYGGYALYMKLFTAEPISGWTSTVLIVLFLGGAQFLGLGILGEYIGKIYAEVKRRPRYFVESVL